MSWNRYRAAALAAALGLMAAPAQAQFYGGGYWGGGGGAHTVQGDVARGMGVAAVGAGRYNLDTAQATAINTNTAMQWNQYMYQSQLESARVYHSKVARDRNRAEQNAEAVRLRLRNTPNSVDIARGDALNVVLDELNNPKVFPKAVDYGHKMKLGGEAIRDIPFQYASAAISVSVHQLTQGGAPTALRTRDEFATDRTSLRAIAAELKKEGDETGTHKPETIQKAKDQILATRTKVEATLAKNSPDRVAADKYLKAAYGFVRMLETPAVGVLLAGVEKHPEATVGDLLGFMASFNLRFGSAETPRQKEVYQMLYPMLTRLRNDVVPGSGSPSESPQPSSDAPMAAFDGMSYDQLNGKIPPPPKPQ